MKIQTLLYKIPFIKKRRLEQLRQRGYTLTALIRSSRKNGSQIIYIPDHDSINPNGKIGNLFLICSCFMGVISPKSVIQHIDNNSIKLFSKYPELGELYWNIRELDSLNGSRYNRHNSSPESIAILETVDKIERSFPSNESLLNSMTNHIDRMCR
jgi:hypothetical protein